MHWNLNTVCPRFRTCFSEYRGYVNGFYINQADVGFLATLQKHSPNLSHFTIVWEVMLDPDFSHSCYSHLLANKFQTIIIYK
jgi:hypothetical protein